MLNTPRISNPTVAYIGNRRIRVSGMQCERCARPFQAADLEIFEGDVRAICANCHTDLITVERL